MNYLDRNPSRDILGGVAHLTPTKTYMMLSASISEWLSLSRVASFGERLDLYERLLRGKRGEIHRLFTVILWAVVSHWLIRRLSSEGLESHSGRHVGTLGK